MASAVVTAVRAVATVVTAEQSLEQTHAFTSVVL